MPTAIVVGGSRGIGAATMDELAGAGWVVRDLSRTSGCDVTKREVLDEALAAEPAPDALVYCAGHVHPQPFADTDDDAWDYHLEVNLTAAARCLRWFANLDRPGAVVLVASTAALRPSPGWSAYSAAKAGLVNLGLTAAEELAPTGVRVYVVAPGRCATHLRAVLAPDEDPATIMQPPEVAAVVRQLLDDHHGVLAGQVIEVKRPPSPKPEPTWLARCAGCDTWGEGAFGDAKMIPPPGWNRVPTTGRTYCAACQEAQ